MSPLEIVGWTCAVLGAVMTLPQIIKLVRTRHTDGLSVLMWQLGLGVSIGWGFHGLVHGWWNMLLPNLIAAAGQAAVLVLTARQRRLNSGTVLVLGFGVGLVGIAMELFSTPALFASTMLIPLAIGAVTQFVDLVREPSIEGVSGGFWFMQVLMQLLWGIWGFGMNDQALKISTVVMGLMSLANMVWWIGRRVGLLHGRRAERTVIAGGVNEMLVSSEQGSI